MQKSLRPCKTCMVPILRKAETHDNDTMGTCMLGYRCAQGLVKEIKGLEVGGNRR